MMIALYTKTNYALNDISSTQEWLNLASTLQFFHLTFFYETNTSSY